VLPSAGAFSILAFSDFFAGEGLRTPAPMAAAAEVLAV
jgi:hypothetical protein